MRESEPGEGERVTVTSRRAKASGSQGDKTDRTRNNDRYNDGNTTNGATAQKNMGKSNDWFRKDTTTFYFTNFPKDWGVEPLWKMFSRWGCVMDVFLPRKRNKMGWPFGFVWFTGVLRVKEMEDSLNAIWIGLYKLRMNVARFD